MSAQDTSRPAWGPRQELKLLNHEQTRLDGPLKVSGRARYTHDVRLPGMSWGRVLCSPYPVVRPTLDLAAARAVKGVTAAIELTDGRRDGWTVWLGQPVAAVAAATPEAAEDGLRALAATWELGSWALTHDAALAQDAPRVHPQGNLRGSNEQGDLEAAAAALDACDVVVDATITIPVQTHASLETHGVVVDWDGGPQATIYASTQSTFSVAEDAARVLGLEAKNVRCVVEHMGGGFGSKFGLDLMGRIACLLARETRAPVHLMFKRADEFVAAGNRSGSYQVLRAGATADGKLRGLVASVHRMGGIGQGSHPGFPYIYDWEAAWCLRESVLTPTDASRAMRAPGHPQASFAIETVVDELAHRLQIDPVTFRMANVSDPVYHRQLERVAREIGWGEHPNRLGPPRELPERAVGIGFALSTWGSAGGPGCEVDVRIGRDGGVTSTVGAQDLGTGTRTYVASIVAEELGLPVTRVTPRIGDSTFGFCVGSGGSLTVPSLAPAVKDAAYKARLALAGRVADHWGSDPADVAFRDGEVVDARDAGRRMRFEEACALLGVNGLEVRGTFQPHLAGRGVHGAQAARVEVDTLTGETRVLDMVAVQDCGLPLNRTAARSQVNGGMIQGLSFGLWEERLLDPDLGLALNAGFEDYKIAGAMDIPRMRAFLDDEDTREQVLGIGEPPVIPGQSAVANAIFNACGVRLYDMPFSRDRIVNALARRG